MTLEQWLGMVMAACAVLVVVGVLSRRESIGARLARWLEWLRGPSADDPTTTRPAPATRDDRQQRSEQRRLRGLTDDERALYVQRWQHLHARAATQPATVLLEADELLGDLLRDIGYPLAGFIRHAEERSASHADVVDDYRAARNVVLDTRLGLAGTAEIRCALAQYVRVFERLADAEVRSDANGAAA